MQITGIGVGKLIAGDCLRRTGADGTLIVDRGDMSGAPQSGIRGEYSLFHGVAFRLPFGVFLLCIRGERMQNPPLFILGLLLQIVKSKTKNRKIILHSSSFFEDQRGRMCKAGQKGMRTYKYFLKMKENPLTRAVGMWYNTMNCYGKVCGGYDHFGN